MLNFSVKSHIGHYDVVIDDDLINKGILETLGTHYIIDRNVFDLLGESFHSKVDKNKIVLIDATEDTKSYQGVEPIITALLSCGLKRDSKLVAIGGGITQDITCFIATTFMRGIRWTFVPTTLLAQADSCIGSKSSINFGNYKNLLGSFNPPNEVYISSQFLETLENKDFKSGIGEIIKLILIGGTLLSPGEITRENVSKYVYDCLMIKREYIEEDEFDKGIRNILNYGHCFGHGIESATHFAIPHGIAITIGMDAANRFAFNENLITKTQYEDMQAVLVENYKEFSNTPIDLSQVFAAMTKDKKNTGSKINLILPVGNKFKKCGFENSSAFWDKAKLALEQISINFQS